MKPLDVEQVAALLQQEGPFAKQFKGYEARLEQVEMLKEIVRAYNENQIALIEAGTGIGKSMAYLLPAVLWTLQNQEKTLISTQTINLQEQLINKDLPLLLKCLGVPLKAAIVKGMGNYLCLRKLEETSVARAALSDPEEDALEKIESWAAKTTTGCRSDISFPQMGLIWEQVSAESDTCTHRKCPHFEQCHFFKARKEAEEANLLISNHSLLLHDLAIRSESQCYDEPALLPPYQKIILDEAHSLEETATSALADKVSSLELVKIASRLSHSKIGKIAALEDKVRSHFSQIPGSKEAMSLLMIELPSLFNDLFRQIQETFDFFLMFTQKIAANERSLRLLPCHFDEPYWINEVANSSFKLQQLIQNISQTFRNLDEIIKDGEDSVVELTAPLRKEALALAKRLHDKAVILSNFNKKSDDPSKVRWIEIRYYKSIPQVHLFHADLDVGAKLRESLFSKFSTLVLLSATLTSSKKFSFVRKRLGIEHESLKIKTITENCWESPFDYKKQALLALAEDMPLPDDPGFLQAASLAIFEAVQASRGNAFVLFTSFAQLEKCFDALKSKLEEHKFHLLKQGGESKEALLEQFKSKERSILFATSSFWQGVDVQGEALRLVIIVKLPFQVPSEPLIEARLEEVARNGGNAFFQYSLPNAIVRFKQGFGRLIRNKTDRGCILCLDSRIVHKPYGKIFLKSLPDCGRLLVKRVELREKLIQFYIKTRPKVVVL